MLKILVNIPLFVWPLFTILVVMGLKAKKTNWVPLKVLLLIPAIFFSWSLSSYLGKYAKEPLLIVFWAVCFGIGFRLGTALVQRLRLRFDKQKKAIEMPGSWIPLILSMSVFSSKFSLGMMRSLLPHLEGSVVFLGIELFSSLILGILAGRAVGCLLKYRSSTSCAVKEDADL